MISRLKDTQSEKSEVLSKIIFFLDLNLLAPIFVSQKNPWKTDIIHANIQYHITCTFHCAISKTNRQKNTQKSSWILEVATRADMFCFFGKLSQINIRKIYSTSVLNYFGFTRYIKKFKWAKMMHWSKVVNSGKKVLGCHSKQQSTLWKTNDWFIR